MLTVCYIKSLKKKNPHPTPPKSLWAHATDNLSKEKSIQPKLVKEAEFENGNRGFYTSAHVLLNLINELRKGDKM